MYSGENLWKRIEEFSRRIRSCHDISKIIVFGSTAKGYRLDISDVDMLIVSDDFKGVRYVERGIDIIDLWHDILSGEDWFCSLQLITLTNEEFEELKNWNTIIEEAVRTGIQL